MKSRIIDNLTHINNLKTLSDDDLRQLSGEIRGLIVDTVSKNGGHLAANLGTVELTIALHRVFDSPKDRIIFDVGHQCYAHKILTGRKNLFPTVRRENGLSGFPKREESPHDAFNTGHSSTSISAAVGMARARDLAGQDHNIIALIGDGALTGGMVWEALNDAGHYGKKIIIILNDNEMSIGKNVGAISSQLSNMRSARGYINLKGFVAKALGKIPLIGPPLKNFVERVKNSVKYLFIPNEIFEQMGFKYYGIVDGHEIADLEKIFEHVRHIDEPVIVHVKTQKGKGIKYAEENPENYHSTSPFDPETGEKHSENYKVPVAMGGYLGELAEKDGKICAVTASMQHGCGLDLYKTRFPDRYFDVGIAEQHAVTMCAGMAAAGYKPVFFVYSTFLQRAYDQLLHDMCMQGLGVTVVVYNSGVVGSDGETHHGVFDVSFLRHIPNLGIASPASIDEAKAQLKDAVGSKKPHVILLPKNMPNLSIVKTKERGRWAKYTKAEKTGLAVFASGSALINAMDAIRMDGLYKNVDVFNASTIKPLDGAAIKEAADTYGGIVTVEDNMLMGGFGSAVLEALEGMDYDTRKFTRLGYDDKYIPHGQVSSLQKLGRVDAQSIAAALKEILRDG
jgi:1-deoxy-D-xylulose-5-phosphate synthase